MHRTEPPRRRPSHHGGLRRVRVYNVATAAAAIFLGRLVQTRGYLRQRLTEMEQAPEHEEQT